MSLCPNRTVQNYQEVLNLVIFGKLGHLYQESYKALVYCIVLLKCGDIKDEIFVCHGEAQTAKD